MKQLVRLGLFAAMVLAHAGCSTPTSGLPTATMQLGSKVYTLEIAATDAAREHGLMERDTLDSEHGMIFIFPTVSIESFWMRHTRFPLDIIFADDQAVVVSTHTMKAYDEISKTSSDFPAKYAIEINAGEVLASGIKPGEKLAIPREVLRSEVK